MKYLIYIFFIYLISNLCNAQNIEDLSYLPHPSSLVAADFKSLQPHIKDKEIIFAGEANHGSKEFYQVKAGLIKYLVKEQELRNVAIEANFAVCFQINEYITWQIEGNPRKLIKKFYVWPYHAEAFVSLITWMRKYNEDKSLGEMVNLWGMDMQQGLPAVEVIKSYLDTLVKSPTIDLPEFSNKIEKISYTPEESTLNKIKGNLNMVSPGNRPVLHHCLKIIENHQKYVVMYKNGRGSLSKFRDSCMAENVKWIYENMVDNGKLLVWAHNSHIQKASKSPMRKEASLGNYIHKWYQDNTYYIGFDFNKGTFVFPSPMKGKISRDKKDIHFLARLLDKEKYELCFIPFTRANQSVFQDEVYMRYNNFLIKDNYTDLFDALFFVNEVTATNIN